MLVLSSMVTVLKLERERGCKVKLALGFGEGVVCILHRMTSSRSSVCLSNGMIMHGVLIKVGAMCTVLYKVVDQRPLRSLCCLARGHDFTSSLPRFVYMLGTTRCESDFLTRV